MLRAVTSTLPSSTASFEWRAEYFYDGSKVRTQIGSEPTFSFTETCGAAPAEGSPIPMRVTLKATDAVGNSATIFSGQGTQPQLQLRIFTCP